MKVIKEDIENLERVKNKQTVQNVVMADAEEQSKMDDETKKLIDPMERKNEKAFLGAKKQPEPKDAKIAKEATNKMYSLDESLFEDTEAEAALEPHKDQMWFDICDAAEKWGLELDGNHRDEVMSCLFKNGYLTDDFYGNSDEDEFDEFDESLKEDLNEADFNDFNSDFYNAITDVLFKYREHEDITRNDVEKAYAFFDSHFYDSDDNEDVMDEDLDKDDNFLKFKKCHPEYNKKFDNKKFGKFFDKNGMLKPEMKKEFMATKISEQVSENDMETSENLDEAKRDPENEDLWTLVYEELCPTSPNFARETKFPDISLGSRYGDDLIRIDRDNNIVVYGKDDAAFDFARQVCDVYGCTFDGLHKSGQFRVDSNGPDFTMYAKIKVPGYSD